MKQIILSFIVLFAMSPGLMAQQHRHHEGRPVFHYEQCDEPHCRVMTRKEAKQVTDYLKSLSFDKDRLNAAMLMVDLFEIPVPALARIAKTFSFDDDRYKFIMAAYPNCPDPEHFDELADVFSFKSTYDKFRRETASNRPRR